MFILEQKWGNDGYSFWFKLLEILGSSDGHYICLGNPSTREFLVAKTHLEVDLCYRILDLLAELEAIDRDLWETEKVIWCQNLVDNVGGVYQKRRADLPQKPSFRNQKPRTSDVSGAETPHSKVSDAETPQSKVKESKGEYSRAEESIVNTLDKPWGKNRKPLSTLANSVSLHLGGDAVGKDPGGNIVNGTAHSTGSKRDPEGVRSDSQGHDTFREASRLQGGKGLENTQGNP